MRAFLVAERRRTSDVRAASHYRNLSVFWKWAVKEQERTASANPMIGIDRIKPGKKAKMWG
jgi:hypothetical protein